MLIFRAQCYKGEQSCPILLCAGSPLLLHSRTNLWSSSDSTISIKYSIIKYIEVLPEYYGSSLYYSSIIHYNYSNQLDVGSNII